jgi:hypothetical protein
LGSGLVDSIRASSRALIDVRRIDDDASTTRALCVCSSTGALVGLRIGSDVGVGVGARGAADDWA